MAISAQPKYTFLVSHLNVRIGGLVVIRRLRCETKIDVGNDSRRHDPAEELPYQLNLNIYDLGGPR